MTGAGAFQARAGLLDPVHIRAKADAPLEADHAGYEVCLIDGHSDNLLVSGGVVIPESFGKVDAASLDVFNPEGEKIASVALAPADPLNKKVNFEFRLRREYLKNSTLSVLHEAVDSMDCATIHLGTFELRDSTFKSSSASSKWLLALAEQGLFGEQDNEFILTDKVPLVTGCRYGFRLYFRGDGRTFPLRVEYTLPSPPKTWGEPAALKQMKISEDGRTASQSALVPGGKLFEADWTIAEGDPIGDCVMKVFVRDELLKTFVFHVQREAPGQGATR